MPTIAELQINVNSTPLKEGTTALENFSNAAEKAARATKTKQQADESANTAASKAALTEKQLADIIDYQSRKLSKLAEQRELVSRSGLKDTNRAAFDELNKKIDANIALVMRQGNASDVLAAKQERELQRLQNIASAYDPVQRAITTYERNIKSLDDGYSKGKLTLEQYNAALASQAAQLEKVKNAQPGSSASMTKEYEDALKAALPYRVELQNLERQQKALDAAKASGRITSPQQIKEYDEATAAIKRQTAEYQRRIQAGQNAGITFKQEQAALRGLPAQFTDIVVSLQGGQAPLTVLLQQGGQIKDTFGGIGPALSGVARGLASIVTPATVAAAAVALVTYEAYQGSQELTEFNKAVVQSAGFSGTSASQFTQYRDQIAAIAGNSAQAADALVALERSGKIAGDVFVQIGVAAINMQKATGQAIQQTVDDFASLGKDPVNAVVALDDKYKFLTSSVLAQIDALQRSGDTQAAVTLAQTTLANATDEAARRMIDKLGFVERAWNAVKGAVSATGSAIANVGREKTLQDELKDLRAQNAEREQGLRGFTGFDVGVRTDVTKDPVIAANNERIKQVEYLISLENFGAKQEAEAEAIRKAGTKAINEQNTALESNIATLDKVAAARLAVTKAEQQEAAIRKAARSENRDVTADELYRIDITNRAAQKKVQDAIDAESRKSNKSSPADTRQVQEVKSNLAIITSEYDGYYKRITSLREANILSDEAAYYAQKAILDAQAKATDDSYAKQISAIKALQGSKKNSESTNISLENQLTKAEAARIKAQQDIQTKQEQNTARFEGDLKKREQAITAYKNALEKQIEAEQARGDRAVIGVGRGDRQRNLSQSLYENDLNFAQEQRELARSGLDRSDPVQYAENLKNLESAHSRMAETIIANDKRIADANYDWTNGYTRAVENAQEDGMNFARSVEMGLTGAFESAGDALATFVTTGKLNFSDFARSVLSDLATIAARQAAMGALGSLFSIAGAGISGYFGGGASSVGSTSAGYTAEYFPNLAAAKGAAFESSGTQFFAQGGAFTNSIVNTPTAFGMAGNKRGVMGEAGPEAIMPLTRTSGGNLGVRVTGGLGGGGTIVNVQVSVTEGQTTTSSDGGGAWDGFGKDLGAFVDGRVRTIINKETRPGGSLKAQNS